MKIWQCVDGHPVCEGKTENILQLTNYFVKRLQNQVGIKRLPFLQYKIFTTKGQHKNI